MARSSKSPRKPASPRGRKPPRPATVDLGTTRNVLEQIEIAHRLASSSSVAPSIRTRLSATIEHLADRLPVVRSLAAAADGAEPSGPQWVERFPGSRDPGDCVEPFRSSLQAFLAALGQAGASVQISATFRPLERAYLMHWSWDIADNAVLPQDVPAMAGVPIAWLHTDPAGQPDVPKSRTAAKQMVSGFRLAARPALQSRHTEGRAVDMTIGWTGNLTIKNKDGSAVTITSTPKTGTNADLGRVGATYGVIKAVFDDDPHWSADGH